MPYNRSGFTLIELLIVIAIISILSVVGIVLFTGIQKEARDSKRRADIDAIAKAYEIKKSNSYLAIQDNDFSSGKKPQDSDSSRGQYFNWLASDGSGFKACASLDANPNTVCNTPATNCYCKVSTQGTLNPSSPVNQGGSTNYTYGLGGSSSQSCDPNGTLLSGLVGYWKMDETNGTTAVDSSGSNNGTYTNGPSSAAHTPDPLNYFKNARSFDGTNDYVDIGGSTSLDFTSSFSIAVWVNPSSAQNNPYPYIVNNSGNYLLHISQTAPYAVAANVNVGGVLYQTSLPSTLVDGSWFHLVYTFNGTVGRIYVNGGQYISPEKPIPGPIDSSVGPVWIGGNNTASRTVSGLIDDVRIYNRALSGGFAGSEISNLYNAGNGCIY